MTYSAFGVDHGEISKMSAPKLPGAHRAAGPTKVGPPKLPGMGDAQKAIGQLKPMAGGVMAGLRGQKPGIPMSPSFNTGAKAGQAVRNNAKPLGCWWRCWCCWWRDGDEDSGQEEANSVQVRSWSQPSE